MTHEFYSQNQDIILDTYHNKNLKTIYQWGVFNGDSMVRTTDYFNSLNITIDKHFGFDTFSGMPEETNEEVDQESWKKGGIDAREYFGISTVEECVDAVYNRLNPIKRSTQIHLIPGLAEETTNDENKNKYGFDPALIIDADFDIYSPTKFCLDYYIKNKIIVEGTFIYYDDWGGVLGWEDMLKGEPRAHKEICKKYDIEFKFLGQQGHAYPHIHRIYQVTKINL